MASLVGSPRLHMYPQIVCHLRNSYICITHSHSSCLRMPMTLIASCQVQELQHQQELKIIPEVTRLEGARKFWPSNARHQNFYETNPTNCYCLNEIMPALRRLKQQYPSTVSSDEVCT
eukprot:739727-Pelagomonas_calceolata.AAC.1